MASLVPAQYVPNYPRTLSLKERALFIKEELERSREALGASCYQTDNHCPEEVERLDRTLHVHQAIFDYFLERALHDIKDNSLCAELSGAFKNARRTIRFTEGFLQGLRENTSWNQEQIDPRATSLLQRVQQLSNQNPPLLQEERNQELEHLRALAVSLNTTNSPLNFLTSSLLEKIFTLIPPEDILPEESDTGSTLSLPEEILREESGTRSLSRPSSLSRPAAPTPIDNALNALAGSIVGLSLEPPPSPPHLSFGEDRADHMKNLSKPRPLLDRRSACSSPAEAEETSDTVPKPTFGKRRHDGADDEKQRPAKRHV